MQLRRDDGEDRLTDDLFFCPSEDAFGALVPAGNDTVQVFADDGIVRRLHDRGQSQRSFVDVSLLSDLYLPHEILARGGIHETCISDSSSFFKRASGCSG